MDTLETTFADAPEDKGIMAVLNAEGDTKYAWDPKNPAEVEAAREHFNNLKAKGFMFFKVKFAWRKGRESYRFAPKDGKFLAVAPETAIEKTEPKTEPAREFDPEADRYVAVAPVAGG